MYEANVKGTEFVLEGALKQEVPKVIYVSTVAAFGNTKGKVVDESYEHDGNYTSYYDETKHLAHQVATKMIEERNLPGIIVMPGSVYGPGDHAAVGNMLRQFVAGKLPLKMFPELGLNLVHRDDVVDGVLLALDKGEIGKSYVLGGEISTMGGMLDAAAKVTGRKAPKRTMPAGIMKASAPLGPLIGPIMGFGPNLKELISSSHNVTFWASHDRAMKELGYSPRNLEQGLTDTLKAEGLLSI
jgi:nucleoside-diphosphate-sugar epimerase